MPDDLGERTEEATPKRRQEAREEGNVAKSQDLAGALLLLIGTMALALLAWSMFGDAKQIIQVVLSHDSVGNVLRVEDIGAYMRFIGLNTIKLGAPILLVLWLAAYITTFLQIGWLMSVKSLQPKLSKLDPIKGFQRVFGLSALVKATLDSLKVGVVVIVAIWAISGNFDRMLLLPQLTILQSLREVGWMMLDLALRVLLVLLLLGILDYMYQRWKHNRDLKMTKQQVKDELKQTEGDPQTKQRRMRMAQQIAQQRIAAAIPKADVIVTNPEHVAVAIQYDMDSQSAPKVIAKGADHLAMRIRQLAMQHEIPILQRPPLARALYKEVAVGQEIPPGFYQAVAEILAYVYRLSGKIAG